jgi:hypothetical protein
MAGLLSPRRFDVPADRPLVARDWQRRGYSCSLFVDPPGHCWNDFVHATNELVTVIEGRLELIVETVKLEESPGDDAYIPRDAVHSVRDICGGTTRWLFGYDRA